MPHSVSTLSLPTATVAAGDALSRFSAGIVFLTLSLGLVLPKVAGAGFLLLALTAIVWLTRNRAWHLRGLHASERLLVLAVLLFVGVWLLAWLWHGLDADGRQGLGRILRLLLIVPLFLYLRRIDGLAAAWWHGLAAGALIAGAHAWWFLLSGQIGEFENRAGGATNPIYFGGIALLMAFMLLARISDPRLPAWARILAAAAVFGGVSASLLSGSRGAWVAAIPLLLLYVLSFGRHLGKAWQIGLPAVFLVTTIGLNLLPQINMDQRLADVAREVTTSLRGQPGNGGVAERIQMWRISLAEIRQRPVLGPGPGVFERALAEAVEDGRASPELLAYRHPHSQLLSAWLHGGIPGLLSLIVLFGLPLRRFWLMRSSSLDSTQTMAWCALASIGMLAVMALSESIFERNIGVIWFSVLLAGSLGLMTSERRRELAAPVQRSARLSVIVIVCNEADRIRHCLNPISGWADEIVILDSGSTDDTLAICREYTDRVEQTDWPGFGPQKQRALDRASGDWVLSLDADEVVDAELKREIDFTLAQTPPRHQAYTLPWLTHAFGTTLQHGHWTRAPLRLFRRDCGRFTPAAVHEKVGLEPGCKTGHLQAPLHHYSYRDAAHARAKLTGYARLQAQERFGAGRRCRWPALAWIRAVLNWIDNYLLRAAFLDGRGGWIMSRLTAAYTLEKYRALARLGRG